MSGARRAITASVLVATGFVLAVSPTMPSLADPETPKGSKQAFTIADPGITESSGLAMSNRHEDTVYTVNDSGGDAQIYAVDGQGETQATLTMRQVEPVDWEAIAPGRDERIWVGDIGDNRGRRENITLYRFREPEVLGDRNLEWGRYPMRYPDQPHDAEALLAHPDSGRVYIVTKGVTGGTIYEGPEDPAPGQMSELEEVAKAPPIITDGAFLPDGSGVVLRSYDKAYVLDWPTWKVEREIALPVQKTGESLTVSNDGERLLVGHEGANSTVWSVPIDGPPPGTTKPRPTESASPSSEPDPGSEESGGAAGNGNGDPMVLGMPMWVFVGVLVVALVAGVVAFPARRRRRVPGRMPGYAPRPGEPGGPPYRGPGPPRPPRYYEE